MSSSVKEEEAPPPKQLEDAAESSVPEKAPAPSMPQMAPAQGAPPGPAGAPPGPTGGAAPAQMPMGQVGSAPGMPPVQQPSRLPPPNQQPAIPPDRAAMMPAEQPLIPPQQGPLAAGNLPMGPNPGQPQPYRQLKVEDALAYLDQVKMKFEKQPHIYNKVPPCIGNRDATHFASLNIFAPCIPPHVQAHLLASFRKTCC